MACLEEGCVQELQPHGWLGADATLSSLQSRAQKSCGSRVYSLCKAQRQAPKDAPDPHQPPMGQITCRVWSVSPQHSHRKQGSRGSRTWTIPGTGPTLQERWRPPR